jgi:hypothetical protein
VPKSAELIWRPRTSGGSRGPGTVPAFNSPATPLAGASRVRDLAGPSGASSHR